MIAHQDRGWTPEQYNAWLNIQEDNLPEPAPDNADRMLGRSLLGVLLAMVLICAGVLGYAEFAHAGECSDDVVRINTVRDYWVMMNETMTHDFAAVGLGTPLIVNAGAKPGDGTGDTQPIAAEKTAANYAALAKARR